MVHSIWKKGSLNLSIEAIVILIMAITMLGLGLGFIRDKFGGASDLIDDVQDKVREDVQRDLSDSNKKMSFPKTEFKLEKGESEVALFGIKNIADSAQDFSIEILVGSDQTLLTQGDTNNLVDFTFGESYTNVGPGDIRLMPMKIQPKSADKDTTYIYTVVIYDSNGDIYGSKQFFVKVI